jgi:LPXTG-site transpeptidase (sortase) family protein
MTVIRRKRTGIFIIAVVLIAASLYLASLVASPFLSLQFHLTHYSPGLSETKVSQENRLYIPRIGVDITYKTGDESVLDMNAWHRFPERGNPEKGGNFILAAHRFELAPTPAETYRKSPFFGIDQLQKDDEIIVDFEGKRYYYQVTEKYTVDPNQTAIEATSTTPKLTLYSCTLGGELDGREVIEARQPSDDAAHPPVQ